MSATSLRAAGQARNEAELLVDSVVVTRPGESTGEIDSEDGLETPGDPVQVWSGPAWIRWRDMVSANNDRTVGGDVVTAQIPSLVVPVSAPMFRKGDAATVTDSIVALNVGMRLTIKGLPGGSFITLARYEVEVITG